MEKCVRSVLKESATRCVNCWMINGMKKDYIKLLYADDDILYLPVEKIDKITKFNGK